MEEYKFPTARLEGKGPFAVGMSLFLEKISGVKRVKPPRFTIVLNLIGEAANASELWLIGELWRLGRGGNLTVNRDISGNLSQTWTIQMQLKATGKVLRMKWRTGKEVEEIPIEEVGAKLKQIEETEFDLMSDSDVIGTAEPFTNPSNPVSDENNVHFVLAGAKGERNPILREKAAKAVKLVNPSRAEIVIHELPRDILKRLLHDNNARVGKVSEEFRDQLMKMGQLLQGKLAGKMVIFVNHKDNQIDTFFNK